MEIRIVKKGQDGQPSPDSPGEQLWYGSTDPGGDNSLPASILSSVIDIGLWYRFSEFREKWDPSRLSSEDAAVTEVNVRLLMPEAIHDKPKGALIRVQSSRAAALAISELLNFVELLETDPCSLWIRID